MSEFLASMFSMLEDGGSELMSMFGFGDGKGAAAAAGGGKGLLGSDGNMLSGVMSALRIAGGHGQAHSQSNAAPYHFTTNANVDTVLNHEANYMKNDINVGSGFNSLKNLF